MTTSDEEDDHQRIQDAEPQRVAGALTGGTSDARFIANYCPVLEFGLVGKTIHATDENVEVADLDGLADIYEEILVRYFR